jgi:hypothetical protein
MHATCPYTAPLLGIFAAVGSVAAVAGLLALTVMTAFA